MVFYTNNELLLEHVISDTLLFHTDLLSLCTALPPPQVEVTPEGSSRAGMDYKLTCSVTSDTNLFSPPTLVWMYSDGIGGSIVDSSNGITVGQPVTVGAVTTLSLMFEPLHTSDGGMYTCTASITIPIAAVDIMNSETIPVNVQSKFEVPPFLQYCSTVATLI